MYSIFERLLQERGVTVADVCRATGIRQSTLSNWKKRNNKLSAKNAELVADYFGVSVDYLMGRIISYQATVPAEELEEYIKPFESLGYYFDEKTMILAQEVFDNKYLQALLDAARGCKPEDLKMARDLLKRLKETNPDG